MCLRHFNQSGTSAGLPWIWISMDGLVISIHPWISISTASQDHMDIHRIFNNRDDVIIKLAILLNMVFSGGSSMGLDGALAPSKFLSAPSISPIN